MNYLQQEKYGRWTVLEKKTDEKGKYLCRCSCGAVKKVRSDGLKIGKSLSCGCFHSQLISNNYIDLTGKSFGSLTVINKYESNNGIKWKCKCICGNYKVASTSHLNSGSIVSCGCYKKGTSKITHGATVDKESDIYRTYKTWAAMKDRCCNERNKSYCNYGGRGITICDRWALFENFLVDMGKKPDGLSLDRIDNNGNYEPDNCRWANQREQLNNTRRNRFISFNNQLKTISEWARFFDISVATLWCRLESGWDIGKALNTPARARQDKQFMGYKNA